MYQHIRKYGVCKNIRLSWSGLWLLLLLLYTDIVNTSVSILNCLILSDSSGRKGLRWYIDGTKECFVSTHIPVAILAVLVLIFSVLAVLFMAAIVMQKIKRHWAFSMSKILRAPFVDKFYWWAPGDLLRRLLFVILVVIFPGNPAPVLLLTMVYVAIFVYIKPYRSMYVNVLEVFTLVDIMLQLMIASTQQFKDPIFKIARNLTDDCGKVNSLSVHAAILVPFYYLPLLMLTLLVLKLVGSKVSAKLLERCHKDKTVFMDHSVSEQLISTAEPAISSYMEYDEYEKDFKIISGSSVNYEKSS